jgi:hypothetical protein
MDRSTATALEKLRKDLAAIAESIVQLRLDIAKLDARVAATDSEVVAIAKRLDRQPAQRADEKSQRDLDLERAVFGQSPPSASQRAAGQTKGDRNAPRSKARKAKSRRLAGRVRRQ